MGYFDGIVEQHFSKEDQQTVFYPWRWYGFSRGGRVIESLEQERNLRKHVKRFVIVNVITMMAAVVVGGILGEKYFIFQASFETLQGSAGILIGGLIQQAILLPLWIYILRVNRLQELKVSTNRLSLFQSLENASAAYGSSTLVLMMVICVVMVVMGSFAFFSNISDNDLNWANVLILLLSTILFGFVFYLWNYMFSKNKKK